MKCLIRFGRCYSSSKRIKIIQAGPVKAKGQQIKNLNIENHQMFGGALKKSKSYKNSSVESLEKTKSSEVYWQTLNKSKVSSKWKKQTKNEETIKVQHFDKGVNDKKEKTTGKKSMNSGLSEVLIEEKPLDKLRIYQRSLPFIPAMNTPPYNLDTLTDEPQNIPFNTQELKGILTFPIRLPKLTKFKWTMHNKTEPSPSVNKILNATMSDNSRNALRKWKSLKIAELGQDGFDQLQKSYLERGKNFHTSLEYYLNGTPIPENLLSKVPELWTSVERALDRIVIPATLIEKKVYHPYLHYNGVVDCLSTVDSDVHLIEWKTSESKKHSLDSVYDAPLQLCAYIGALNSSEFIKDPISKGVIIVAYTNGKPSSLHFMEEVVVRKYWSAWLFRLNEYWIRYRDKTLPELI